MANQITECTPEQMAYHEGVNKGLIEAYDFCISRLRKAIKYSKEDLGHEINENGEGRVSESMMDDIEYLEYILDGIIKRKEQTTISED